MMIHDILLGQHKILYKGGGGSSGAVSFPAHMEDRHEDWLGTTPVLTTVSELINTGHATNPLESLDYTDPSTKIAYIDSEYDSWNTAVDAADADVDISAAFAEAAAEVDTEGVLNEIDVTQLVQAARSESFETTQSAVLAALEAIDDVRVYDAVQAFVSSRRLDRAQLRSRYKAGMSNVGAERSSAYAIGMALLEMEFERETSQFQTELSTQMYQQGLQVFAQSFTAELRTRLVGASQDKQSRDEIMSRGIQLHLQHQQFLYELRRQLVTVLSEINRISFVMDSEYVANTADLNWKYASWDWNVYAQATAVLGGIGGGSYVPEGPTKTGSAVGGALSGAAVGAQIGSVVPGVGTAIGAGVGALAGGLAGLFG